VSLLCSWYGLKTLESRGASSWLHNVLTHGEKISNIKHLNQKLKIIRYLNGFLVLLENPQ